MDFTRIIMKYETDMSINKISGSYVNGKWVETPCNKQFKGTLIPLTPEELRYYEAGTYTTKDMKLFVSSGLKDLEGNDLFISNGDVIINDNIEYTVSSDLRAPVIMNYEKFICKKKVDTNE